MNVVANLRTDGPLAVRLLVTHADDFGRDLITARKKLEAAELEVRRIEKARADVAEAIGVLGFTYEPEETVRAAEIARIGGKGARS
jgi:hypothetical protein